MSLAISHQHTTSPYQRDIHPYQCLLIKVSKANKILSRPNVIKEKLQEETKHNYLSIFLIAALQQGASETVL